MVYNRYLTLEVWCITTATIRDKWLGKCGTIIMWSQAQFKCLTIQWFYRTKLKSVHISIQLTQCQSVITLEFQIMSFQRATHSNNLALTIVIHQWFTNSTQWRGSPTLQSHIPIVHWWTIPIILTNMISDLNKASLDLKLKWCKMSKSTLKLNKVR